MRLFSHSSLLSFSYRFACKKRPGGASPRPVSALGFNGSNHAEYFNCRHRRAVARRPSVSICTSLQQWPNADAVAGHAVHHGAERQCGGGRAEQDCSGASFFHFDPEPVFRDGEQSVGNSWRRKSAKYPRATGVKYLDSK